MKINELKEGFFSDVGDVLAPDRYREQDPKKRQAGIQRAFLKDFVNDFYVDLRDNIKAGVIGGVAEKTKEVPGSEYAPQGQSGTQFDPNMQTKLNEYAVFNSVIESIINEQQKTPMNTWIVKWFNAYMQGVNWQQERSTVEKIATEIAKSYNQNKSLTGLDQLANLAWEITSDKKGFPGGASNIVQGSGSGRDSITAREIAKNPGKRKDFVDNLTNQELSNLRDEIEKKVKLK
jgi:hypothetical protein